MPVKMKPKTVEQICEEQQTSKAIIDEENQAEAEIDETNNVEPDNMSPVSTSTQRHRYKEADQKGLKNIYKKEKICTLSPSVDAANIGKALSKTEKFYYNKAMKNIVMIDNLSNGELSEVLPAPFVTELDNHIYWYKEVWGTTDEDEGGRKVSEVPINITIPRANIILTSNYFKKELSELERIFTIPTPILKDGKVTLLADGYDPIHNSYLMKSGLTVKEMPLDEAHKLIEFIMDEVNFERYREDVIDETTKAVLHKEGEFTEAGKKSKTHAIAALMTPYLRGLYPCWNVRTPLFFYRGNRPRVGKDYLAGITGILYEGVPREAKPLTTEAGISQLGNSSAEFGKLIMGCLITGKKRLHFANNKGCFNVPSLEAVLTATEYTDRMLGGNKVPTLQNEIDYSASGNKGISFTEDIENRIRFIELVYAKEDINNRVFKNPNLQMWVKQHRQDMLSAIYTFIKEWERQGMPQGDTAMMSFPEWSAICGGIMKANGFEDPCVCKVSETPEGDGNDDTADWTELFSRLYDEFHDSQGFDEAFTIAQINNLMTHGSSKNGNIPWIEDMEDKFVWYELSESKKHGSIIKLGIQWKIATLREYGGFKVTTISKLNTHKARTKYRMKPVPKTP